MVDGLAVSVYHASGIIWNEKDHSICAPNISSALGLRVLRRYFHPETVAEREQQRKDNRQHSWTRLRPVDHARLIGWTRCHSCWEKNWCITNNPDETPRTEPICEECFNEDLF